MILHWGSAEPSPCSDPCCSCASPQSITHKWHWELLQSPAKSWVGTAGGFTSSPCDCKFVNNWEVTVVYLFIYLFKRKGTLPFPVGVVPGCHLEVALLWHWGSLHSTTPAGHRNLPGTPEIAGLQHWTSLRLLFKGMWRKSTTVQWIPLNCQIHVMLRWHRILPLAEFNIWTTFLPQTRCYNLRIITISLSPNISSILCLGSSVQGDTSPALL